MVSSAAIVNHHSSRRRSASSQWAPSAHSPASALATTTTHATTAWTSRSATRGVSPQPWPDEPVATSYDHSSLDTDTGPPWGCGASAPWCPCAKAGLFTQAWKASSSRHRVTTSQVVRPSVGRSSSKPSKPSWSSTAPARAAKRLASSSPEPSGTVMALILMTVTKAIMPAPPPSPTNAPVQPPGPRPPAGGCAGSAEEPLAQPGQNGERPHHRDGEAQPQGGERPEDHLVVDRVQQLLGPLTQRHGPERGADLPDRPPGGHQPADAPTPGRLDGRQPGHHVGDGAGHGEEDVVHAGRVAEGRPDPAAVAGHPHRRADD